MRTDGSCSLVAKATPVTMSSDRSADSKTPGPSRRATQLRALLDDGIAAAQRGQVERARRLFEGALAIDGSNEDAWLWLGAMAQDRELARAIYQRVLVAHPESARAREALRWLDQVQADSQAPSAPPAEEGEETLDDLTAAEIAEPAAHLTAGQVAVGAEQALEGPALFVPPWEIGAPIPVLESTRPETPDPVSDQDPTPGQDVGEDPMADQAVAPQETPPQFTLPYLADGQSPRPIESEAGASDEKSAPSEDRATIESLAQEPDQVEPGYVQAGDAAERSAELGAELLPLEEITVPDTQATPTPETSQSSAATVQAQSFEPLTPRPVRLLRHGLMLAMLGFVLLGSLGMIAMLGSQSRADKVRLALGVITDTPTVTPTYTITPTPTATPTAPPTLPFPPSPTLSPTLTLTPSPTSTPKWVTKTYLPLPLEEKWIEVDLGNQKLKAYEGAEVVFETEISSGKAHTPTLVGKFRIMRKFESQLMSGPGYYLPGVPWVMYFYGGYALHGAYWHDKWGTPTSHGCVNLRIDDAKWLYDWSDPVVPEGAKAFASTKEYPGTWVLIHK